MLIRILAFLLETLFFVLIAAALLRAWMNWTRVNMTAQPGNFVMAVTDWIVKPLRRTLPARLVKSKIDWASLLAATALALIYALLWSLLFGVLMGVAHWMPGLGSLITFLIFAAKMLVRFALQTTMLVVFLFVVLSWVQPGSPFYSTLGRLTNPLLAPLRRVVPTLGGIDLSALVLILILQVGLMVVS